MNPFHRESLVAQLKSHRATCNRLNQDSGETEFLARMPSLFHAAWLAAFREPPVPRLQNTDGNVVLQAILYATSAGVAREVREGAPKAASEGGNSNVGAALNSDEVYFLPGKIEVSRFRQLQALSRVSSGRNLLHRFMVRGHWRRPARHFAEQRMRWIAPYWKGPKIAAVVERTYRLTT